MHFVSDNCPIALEFLEICIMLRFYIMSSTYIQCFLEKKICSSYNFDRVSCNNLFNLYIINEYVQITNGPNAGIPGYLAYIHTYPPGI